MEDAGYTRERLRHTDGEDGDGQVGVYAGVMWGQYQLLFPGGDTIRGNPNAIGSSYASVANRVSFVMNLHGPSMTVDTMCSSSLTAVELACRDLRQGRTKLAFAGGVNVTVHPNKYLALSTGQFISGKGHCESFGIGGDGYIPGEGVGVVLLKPLHDAERDGDHIYGVIKGSGMSHGGRTNGYTVPNPRAQQAAIHGALREAGVDPRTVSYVEAHGTGTKLGDPIEITGLSQAFRTAPAPGVPATADSQYCYLGSAKSNIGHCESAAGIAGLTKVLLQLQHGRIAPSLHSATLNPNIDFTRTPFVVNQELRDWERPVVDGRTHPRIAGISSFGAGGSNAHLVVAEHVDLRPAPSTATRTPLLFPLSAKNEERLRAYAAELLRFAREADAAGSPRTTPADLAYTLQAGREAMDERLGVIADSFAALAGKLERYLTGEDSVEGLYRGNAKRDRQTLSLIPAEELAETLDKLVQRGKPAELLELWVRGASPDWRRLRTRTTPAPRMISAPTYPFARERHWIPETAQVTEAGPEARAGSTNGTRPVPGATTVRTTGAAAGTGPSTGFESPSRAALFLTKQWRPTPTGTARTRHTAVVVLHDRSTRRLAEALSAHVRRRDTAGGRPGCRVRARPVHRQVFGLDRPHRHGGEHRRRRNPWGGRGRRDQRAPAVRPGAGAAAERPRRQGVPGHPSAVRDPGPGDAGRVRSCRGARAGGVRGRRRAGELGRCRACRALPVAPERVPRPHLVPRRPGSRCTRGRRTRGGHPPRTRRRER